MFIELTDEIISAIISESVKIFELTGHKITDADAFVFCSCYTGNLLDYKEKIAA